jgi:hypothetical protein
MAKLPKSEVNYSPGMVHSHCGPVFHDDKSYCEHFIPRHAPFGLCEGVAGEIDPKYWCERFKRAKK